MDLYKKALSLLLAVLIVLAIPLGAFAKDLSFQTEEELLEHLRQLDGKYPDSIEFSCGSDLYARLSANDFTDLYRLLFQAGIDGLWARISYQDSSHLIKLSSLKQADRTVYECETTADLHRVFDSIAKEKSEGAYLLCSASLFKTLNADAELINYAAAKHGIDHVFCSSYEQYGLFKLSSMSCQDGPFAYVEDYAQFAAAIDHFSKQNLDEFYIAFSKPLFKKIIDNKAELRVMIAGSKLEKYGYSGGTGGILHFFSVTYTDIARAVCRDTGELADIISQMGASGVKEFEIIFPDTAVFDALYENNFELLHQIEAEAGMTSGKLRYSMNHDMIAYEEAAIVSNVVALSSLSDAVSYLEKAVADGESEIHLFCTEKLYNDLLGDMTAAFVIIPDGMTRIYDLVSQAGICDYDLSSFATTHVISISIKKLFPGTAIVLAEKSGDLSGLSARELETREAALKVAEEAESSDPLQTAKYIHDWLCAKNVYTNDETTDEDDTAIGAILNGEANCDGYTDAFYLIGSLAGLNVRYQHGDSYEKGLTLSLTPITHIWNLLEIDGEWRMVDVTWDDEGDSPIYVWFNVGEDVASLMHTWNADMTVPLAMDTDRVYTAECEFYVSDISGVQDALGQMKSLKPENCYIIAPGLSSDDILQVVRDSLGSGFFRYSWNDRMSMFTAYDLTWK